MKYDPVRLEVLAVNMARELATREANSLTTMESFPGAGIYALYYVGPEKLYKPLTRANRNETFKLPIYIGKADPPGSRKGGRLSAPPKTALFGRLKDHRKKIEATDTLSVDNFYFRILILDPTWIRLAESGLIDLYSPVWNVVADGFGNKAVGKGRDKQAPSAWDILHPDRENAELVKTLPKGELRERDKKFKVLTKKIETELRLASAPDFSRSTLDLIKDRFSS